MKPDTYKPWYLDKTLMFILKNLIKDALFFTDLIHHHFQKDWDVIVKNSPLIERSFKLISDSSLYIDKHLLLLDEITFEKSHSEEFGSLRHNNSFLMRRASETLLSCRSLINAFSAIKINSPLLWERICSEISFFENFADNLILETAEIFKIVDSQLSL